MIRRRLTAAALALALVAVAMMVQAVDADAAGGHRVLILQFNAAEGTTSCMDPASMNCLSTVTGNRGRDMYAVEEVCYPDYVQFKKAHRHWAVLFGRQTVRLNAGKSNQCKYKGDMLASPHTITNRRIYHLSKSFTKGGIQHNFLLVCGLIHASAQFYGCSTHLVFPRRTLQKTQVNNLVRDTASYRRHGKAVIAGDFNIPESSKGAGNTPRLHPITKARYVETDSHRRATHNRHKFDYIFYFSRAGVSHRAALTGGVATSDHSVLLGEARI